MLPVKVEKMFLANNCICLAYDNITVSDGIGLCFLIFKSAPETDLNLIVLLSLSLEDMFNIQSNNRTDDGQEIKVAAVNPLLLCCSCPTGQGFALQPQTSERFNEIFLLYITK